MEVSFEARRRKRAVTVNVTAMYLLGKSCLLGGKSMRRLDECFERRVAIEQSCGGGRIDLRKKESLLLFSRRKLLERDCGLFVGEQPAESGYKHTSAAVDWSRTGKLL